MVSTIFHLLLLFDQNKWRIFSAWKDSERKDKLASLPDVYSNPLSSHENEIHSLSISQLVSRCQAGSITLFDVLMTYGKRTVYAQKAVNCISDIMFDEALDLANHRDPRNNVDRPLLGVPVSIKDTVDIFAHDTTIGYSRNVHRPAVRSSAIVRLLQDAGALIHAKTTVPIALVSLETRSDVFGVTLNPHNPKFSPGSSTGGGAALLALGGSKIEIGTDVGGSVRIPAHFCGVYGMRSSIGRFPVWGTVSSMMGLEGIQISCSPMAGNLEDLEEFWERVVGMKPWKYDHSVSASHSFCYQTNTREWLVHSSSMAAGGVTNQVEMGRHMERWCAISLSTDPCLTLFLRNRSSITCVQKSLAVRHRCTEK